MRNRQPTPLDGETKAQQQFTKQDMLQLPDSVLQARVL